MKSPVKLVLDYCLLEVYYHDCWSFSILVLVCPYFLTLMGSDTLLVNLLISLVCLFPWNTISGSNLLWFFFSVVSFLTLINDFIWAFSLFFFWVRIKYYQYTYLFKGLVLFYCIFKEFWMILDKDHKWVAL